MLIFRAWATCDVPSLSIYTLDTFLFFWELNKNNTKFQRKRGGRSPLGQPLNPPSVTSKEYSKYGIKQIRVLSKIQVQVIKIKRSKQENTNVDKIKTNLAWLS